MAIPPFNQSSFDEKNQNQQNDRLKKSVSAPAFIPSEYAMVNGLTTNDTFSLSSSCTSNTPTPRSSTPSQAPTPTIDTLGQRFYPLLPLQYTSSTSFGHLDDRDAMYIFEGVRNGSLLKIERPLTGEECRNLVKPGAVFVFDEGPTFKSWVDGRIWSEVVQNGAFAFFRELLPQASLNEPFRETGFIKKCTSLYVPEERVFRHLVSYYHHETLHQLPRPVFDPSLCLHPSYFGRLDSYADAQILVDGVDYGILHRARRPPLSFEIDILIMPGSIFVWDDAVPGSRWWGDGKLWQPSQIAGAMVVFREMETVIMEDLPTPNGNSPTVVQTSTTASNQNPAIPGLPRFQSNPQAYAPPGQPQNTVVKILPKSNGLIKKVMTLSSNKSGRIYQIIAYVSDASIGLHQTPSMDRQLHQKIASVAGFFTGLGTGVGIPGAEVLVAPINRAVDHNSNSVPLPHPTSSTIPNRRDQEGIPPSLIETFVSMRVAANPPTNDLSTEGMYSSNNVNNVIVPSFQDHESMSGEHIQIRLPDPHFERRPRYQHKRRSRTSTASTPSTPSPDATSCSSQKTSAATSNNARAGNQQRPAATTRSLATVSAFTGSRKEVGLTLTTSNLNRSHNGDKIATPRSA